MKKSVGTIGEYAEKPAWKTISVVSLGLLGSITAELILTDSVTSISDEPGLNKQMLGRAITALAAFFTMLMGANSIRKADQRLTILLLLTLLALSNILIVRASDLGMFILGRLLLGLVTGSFSVVFVTMIRSLYSKKYIEKSLILIFPRLLLLGGAMIILGCILEKMLGFTRSGVLINIIVLLLFVFQLAGQPNFKTKNKNSEPGLSRLLANRANKIATMVTVLLFGSQSAFIMYLSAFVKAAVGSCSYLSSVILITFLISNFLGCWLNQFILKVNPYLKLIVLPAVLACLLWIMILNDRILWLTYLLVLLAGLLNGPFVIGWARWLTQNFTAIGSFLLLAVVQLSFAFGAISGWIFWEIGEMKAVLAFTGTVLLTVPICILIFCSALKLSNTDRDTSAANQAGM